MTTQLQYIEKDTCDDALLSLSALQKIDAWGACEHETRIRRKQCLESSSIAASRRTFRQLVKKWRDETWFISSIKKRIAHPDYLKIIGMGSVAIPWILEELRGEPDYWFAALEAITREDPAPNAENLTQLRDAWLAWGERRAR